MTSDNPPVEQLMHHEPWVRRLVRRLVAERDVDDAVQQTWLAALREKSPIREPLAWLGGVARRQALMLRRRETRIKKREGAAEAVDRRNSTSDIVAELAAQRSITKAVSELSEPYRETVLLRFYRDLSTAETARTMGVTGAAVRQRLSRGMAMLRSRLSSEFGTEWRRSAPVIALAQLPKMGAVVGATLTTGVILMKKPGVVALGLVALVGALFVVVRPGGDSAGLPPTPAADAPGMSAPLAGETREVGEAAPRSTLPTVAATEPRAIAVATPPRMQLRGRVISPDGEPLPNVALGRLAEPLPLESVVRWRPIGADAAVDTVRLGASDIFGEFELDCDAFSGVLVALDGHFVLRCTPVLADEPDQELLVIATPAVRLRGFVVDPDGVGLAARVASLPGALTDVDQMIDETMRSGNGFAETDRYGEFELIGLPGGMGVLQFQADDHRTRRIPIPDQDATDLRVVLQPGVDEIRWRVRAVVRDLQGLPVPGALVDMGGDRGRSDDTGEVTFQFSSLEVTGMSDWITASLPGREGAHVVGMRDRLSANHNGVVSVELVLGPPTMSLIGRVYDAGGEPRSGLVVYPWNLEPTDVDLFNGFTLSVEDLSVDPDAEHLRWERTATRIHDRTNASGRFELPGLRDRAYNLRIYDPVSGHAFTTGDLRPGQDAEIHMPAILVREDVSGTVVDRAGRAIVGCDVTALVPAMRIGEYLDFRQAGETTTSADGRFGFARLPSSTTHLTIQGPEILPVEVAIDSRQRYVVQQRCYVRLAGDPSVTRFSVLDAQGREMSLYRFDAERYEETRLGRIVDGRTPVFCIGEEGTTLVLRDGEGTEIRRVTLELEPGPVQTVNY